MTLLAPLTLLAALATAAAALAGGGVYTSTRHGDRATGVQRVPDRPRGDCSQCHDQHASRGGVSNGGPYPYALFAPDDTSLCATCHASPSTLGIYQGAISYGSSSHATSSRTVWPGPSPAARPTSDAGTCVNCHTPHGSRDGSGPIPALTFAREEALCLACHTGNPASDEASQFRKAFTHPVAVSSRHDEAEEGDPARYGSGNRHAECADCHNPHEARADVVPPGAPAASARLRGVGRVTVTNGAAGTRPLYTWVGPSSGSAFAREYEVCFKCHSSFTTLPAGKTDLALRLNPANASFHPVEEAGRNEVAATSFVNGWSRDRLTYCSDCHGSDDAAPTPRGPHGSNVAHLLKAAYPVGVASQASLPTDLCFSCHSYDTYADPNAPKSVSAASRFNSPGESHGHSFHVGNKDQTCWSCHETHGSVLLPGLMVVGRVPGLVTYSQSATGGTCTTTCHGKPGAVSYSINYPR